MDEEKDREEWIPGCPFPMRFPHLPPKRMDSIHSPQGFVSGSVFHIWGKGMHGWVDGQIYSI